MACRTRNYFLAASLALVLLTTWTESFQQPKLPRTSSYSHTRRSSPPPPPLRPSSFFLTTTSSSTTLPSFSSSSPLRAVSGDNDYDDDDEVTTINIWNKIDAAGQSLKPKAVRSNSKLALAETKSQRLKYILQTCVFYTLFIIYRAYRGFFVILPAVFREVYKKLQTAVDNPYDEENGVLTATTKDDDTNPQSGKVRWRTRITVSVLASIVTASYVLGGALRVLTRFVRKLTQDSGDVSGAFAAAASEQETNEDRIMRFAKKNRINGEGKDPPSSSSSSPSYPSDLAP